MHHRPPLAAPALGRSTNSDFDVSRHHEFQHEFKDSEPRRFVGDTTYCDASHQVKVSGLKFKSSCPDFSLCEPTSARSQGTAAWTEALRAGTGELGPREATAAWETKAVTAESERRAKVPVVQGMPATAAR